MRNPNDGCSHNLISEVKGQGCFRFRAAEAAAADCPNDRLPAAPPLLGEHTRDVLHEIGNSADKIAELEGSGTDGVQSRQ